MADLIFPLPFKRQYAGPLDVDMVFDTIAEKNSYLTNARRYSGQVVSCLEEEGKLFVLNNSRDAWVEVSGSSPEDTIVTSTVPASSVDYEVDSVEISGGLVEWTIMLTDSTNYRAEKILSITDGNTVQFSSNSTLDIGNTSDIAFNVIYDVNKTVLTATNSGLVEWTVKSYKFKIS